MLDFSTMDYMSIDVSNLSPATVDKNKVAENIPAYYHPSNVIDIAQEYRNYKGGKQWGDNWINAIVFMFDYINQVFLPDYCNLDPNNFDNWVKVDMLLLSEYKAHVAYELNCNKE